MPTQTPLRQTEDQQKITNQAKKHIYLLTPMARQITHTKMPPRTTRHKGKWRVQFQKKHNKLVLEKPAIESPTTNLNLKPPHQHQHPHQQHRDLTRESPLPQPHSYPEHKTS